MSCTSTCIQPSPSQAHCSVCHRTWGGVTSFDRHRRNGQCLTPEQIGYADNGRGVYRAPMSEAGIARLASLRTPQTAAEPSGVGRPRVDPSEAAETLSGGTEVIHLITEGRGTTSCCYRSPFELTAQDGHRITVEPDAATCGTAWRWDPDGNGGWISAPRHHDGTHCWTGPDCPQEHT